MGTVQIPRIDAHTHILPGLDDGASDEQMSREMLSQLASQGVQTVLLSSHYYSGKQSVDDFLDARDEAYDRLCATPDLPAVDLRLGAEVYLTKYLLSAKDITRLCIDGTRVMLIELPFDDHLGQMEKDLLYALSGDYMIKPLLAHIERYPGLIGSERTLDELKAMGCRFQMNASSLTHFGKGRLLKLAERGYLHCVGTDCHNLDTRSPDLSAGMEMLEKKLSAQALSRLSDRMTAVFAKE